MSADNPSNTPADRQTSAGQPAASSDQIPHILVFDAQGSPTQTLALTRSGVTIGRLANNTLQLDAPVVSRSHARIDWDGARVLVTDLGSKSGTQLGMRRLSPQTPHVWDPAQTLQIGPYTLRLHAGAPVPADSADLHAAPTRKVGDAGLMVTLSPAYTALTLIPGEPTNVEVRVTNRTHAPQTVALSLSGLPETWVEPAPTLRVAPFSMKTTSIRIQAPASMESIVRPYEVRLRATSQEDPSLSAELRLEWRVAPFLAGEMQVAPHRARGREQAVVTAHLHNGGNVRAMYHLRAGETMPMVGVAFAQEHVTLEPGESVGVPLTITAPRRVFGSHQVYKAPVEVEETDEVSGSLRRTLHAEVHFVQTTLLPLWAPVVLFGILLLLYGLNLPASLWARVPGSGFLAGAQSGNIRAEATQVAAFATQQALQGQTALADLGAALAATQSAVAVLPTEQQASAQTALAQEFQATVVSLSAAQTANAQALAATNAAIEAQLAQTAVAQNVTATPEQASTVGAPTPTVRLTATTAPSATASPRSTAASAPSATPVAQPTTVAVAGAEAEPSTIAFGSIKKGTTSAPRTLLLKNTGTAPLTIDEIVIGGVHAAEFARVVGGADNCGALLAPGASCTITLTFTPSAAGQRTGQLRIENSSAGGVVLVSLSGRGTEIPEVASIVRVGSSPTNAASVQFQVNFSEPVKGVTTANFSVVILGGVVGAGIAAVSPASSASTNQWTVTVNVGGGNKTIRLDFVNSNGVANADGNQVEKLPFNAGEQFVIDTTVPTVALGSTPPSLTNNPAAPFTFSGNDDVSSSVTFECRVDAASFAPCTSPFTPAGLADGNHTFNVRARDQAGNVSAPASYTWTVDTTPPDTTMTGGPANSSTSGLTVTFTFSSEAGATFQCRIDSGTFSACTSPFTVTGLTDGSHTFHVRAVDTVGNIDPTPATRTWTVDATPPDTTMTGGPTGVISATSVTFTFTSTETGSTFQCRLNTGSFTSCTSPHTISGLSNGPQTFEVRAIDAVNNIDPTPATRTWTVDALPPAVTSVTSTTPNDVYGIGATINVTVNFNESVTLTGGSLQVSLNSGTTVTIAPFSGISASGAYVVGAGQNAADLDSLSLTLTAGATLRDAAGNNAILTIPTGQSLANLHDIVIDTTAPAPPAVTNPITDTTVPSTTTALNITGDAEANSLVQVWNDGNNNGTIDTGETVAAFLQLTGGNTSFSIPLSLTTGANNFVVTATDAASNRSLPTDVPTITRSP